MLQRKKSVLAPQAWGMRNGTTVTMMTLVETTKAVSKRIDFGPLAA